MLITGKVSGKGMKATAVVLSSVDCSRSILKTLGNKFIVGRRDFHAKHKRWDLDYER